jgi:hypothetical protein
MSITSQIKNKISNYFYEGFKTGGEQKTNKKFVGTESTKPNRKHKSAMEELREAVLVTWPPMLLAGVVLTAAFKPETFNPILPKGMKIVGAEQKAIKKIEESNLLKKQYPNIIQSPKI